MKKRIPRPARCPTMVALLISPEVETTELMAVLLFRNGTADKGQFNILADCRDLLMLAAHDSRGFAVETERVRIVNLGHSDECAEADAYLMAAAPDLLAALQAVVAISDRKHDAWDAAKAAIDKALGLEA